MKNEDFKNLLQGVKELKLYRQKKLKPSRVFNYVPAVKEIRATLKMYQRDFRVYLDEYPEQKEVRKRYFLFRYYYKTNWLYCKEVLEEERRLIHD